jgi:hypothetical protein
VSRACTDAEGHFLLRDLPPGVGRLVISAKEYVRVECELPVGDATQTAPTRADQSGRGGRGR